MAEETEATPVAGWHWPYMEREEFEEQFQQPVNGLSPSTGVWAVRMREGADKCTHHLIERDPDGFWQINKKTYGTEYTDLFDFVERLKYPLDGWRVPLTRAVRNPELDPEWLHGEMSTEDATDLMNRAVEGNKTDADGTFFARRKPGMSDQELVLCIYFKNKPTHHLCTQQPDGSWLINKKPYGRSSEPCSVEEMVEQFYEDVPGWPVRFKRAVARRLGGDGSTQASQFAGGVAAVSQAHAPAEDVDDSPPVSLAKSTAPAASSSLSGAGSDTPVGLPIWLHGPMEKEESSQILTDGCGGTVKHGAFFVRERIDHPGEFVLCCGFSKGGAPAKPTHHHVVAREEDGVFVVNKKVFGTPQTTLVGMIEQLMQPNVPGWPVQLTMPIPVPSSGGAPPLSRGNSIRSITGRSDNDETEAAPKIAAAPPPRPAKDSVTPAVAAPPAASSAGSDTPAGLPIWLHGPMEKEESSQILENGCGGTVKHGAFFVRERIDHPGEFVLCCGFSKGGAPAKPTHHHVVAREEDGVFVVNKKVFGTPQTTLVGMIEQLMQPNVPGWPVQLTMPIPVPSSGGAPPLSRGNSIRSITGRSDTDETEAPPKIAAAPPPRPAKDPVTPAVAAPPAASPSAGRNAHAGLPIWLHGPMEKEESSQILADGCGGTVQHGAFFVREHIESSEFVLCVGFSKGGAPAKPTHHHVVAREEDGVFVINKKVFGTPQKTLVGMIEQLMQPNVPGWPVQLTMPIPVPSSGGVPPLIRGDSIRFITGEPGSAGGDSQGQASGDDNSVVESTPPVQPKTKGRPSLGIQFPSWLHGPMEKEAANQLLEDGCGGTVEHGAFLVRERLDHPGEFVLTVGFSKGGAPAKPTHHQVLEVDGTFTVGKKIYGEPQATLVGLIEQLMEPNVPGWPVQLTKPIGQATAGSGGGAVTPPPAARVDSVRSTASSGSEAPETLMPSRALKPSHAVSDGNPVWFHGTVSKNDSEAVLVAASNTGQPEHGAFFVRELADKSDSFGLVVGFEKAGKPPKTTHHLIEYNEEGVLTINKRVFGSGTNNLVALIEELGTGAVEAWPVPLTKPVPVPPNGLRPSFVLPGSATASGDRIRRDSGDDEAYAQATAPEQRGPSLRRSTAERNPWLHGEITRSEAEDLILGADSNGQLVDGTWLVRKRSPFDPARPEYVIAVAYEGAVTHHLVEFDDVNGESCNVNGSRVDGASDIAQLITIIQTMPSWWKAELKKFVPVSASSGGRRAAATPAVSSEAAAPQQEKDDKKSKKDSKKDSKRDSKKDKKEKGDKGKKAGETSIGRNIEFTLKASAAGFGLKLDAGRKLGGVFISGASAGSVAEAHPDVIVGRHLVAVDGVALDTAEKQEAVALLKGKPQATLVVREDPARFASRHLDVAVVDRAGPVVRVNALKQPDVDFGLSIVKHADGSFFIDSIRHLSAASMCGSFRRGMQIMMVNDVNLEVQKNYSLNDLLALMTHAAEVLMDVRDDLPRFNAGASTATSSTTPSQKSSQSTPARPDYDDHGATDVLRGGTLGESTIDNAAFSYIMPPSDINALRRYIALRPKIEFDLGRTYGESWGFTVSTDRIPMVVMTVTPNGVAERAEMEVEDIVVEVNGVSALDNPKGVLEQLNTNATSLVVLTTKYWLGGLTHEAQNEKRNAINRNLKVGRAVCPDEAGEALEVGYVLNLDGVDVSSSRTDGRWAEEDHYHESGDYYADE